MKSRCFKWILTTLIALVICATFIYVYMISVQAERLNEVTRDLSYYYQISCPNGNALCITNSDNLKYNYELSKYSFSLTESEGAVSYKSVTDIGGNTKFYRTGLLSGSSSMNYETDFPQCVINKNDSTDIQRFFYPSFDDSEIKVSHSDGGKIYISFNNSISYDKTIELVDEIENYGIVTWMWVDTYGKSNMDTNPITIQNPIENNTLPVHGIALYNDGDACENPLDDFLYILNNAFCSKSDNSINEKLKEIKLGITNSNKELCKEDIKIIGLVLIPYSQSNNERNEIFQSLNKIDNVRLCT